MYGHNRVDNWTYIKRNEIYKKGQGKKILTPKQNKTRLKWAKGNHLGL